MADLKGVENVDNNFYKLSPLEICMSVYSDYSCPVNFRRHNKRLKCKSKGVK